jgi:hypothetical protein
VPHRGRQQFRKVLLSSTHTDLVVTNELHAATMVGDGTTGPREHSRKGIGISTVLVRLSSLVGSEPSDEEVVQ